MSDISPIALQLILSGQDQVKQGLKDTAGGLKDVTTAAQETAQQLRNAINVGGAEAWSPAISALKQLQAEEKAAAQAAKDLATAEKQSARDFAQAEKEKAQLAKDFAQQQVAAQKLIMDADKQAAQAKVFAAQQAQTAQQKMMSNLATLRMAGMELTMVGAGGLMLDRKLEETAKNVDGVEQRLRSLLQVQGRAGDAPGIEAKITQTTEEGHFASSNEIRNATVLLASYSMETEHIKTLLPDVARQARTMGLSLDEVANQFGKAYGSGNVGMLRRAGVALTNTEIEAVKAAYGISQANGQMEFMKAVTAAVERNSVALGDSLTDAQKAANDLAREGEKAMTAMGEGAQEARREVGGVEAALLHVLNVSPGVERAAGYLNFFSSTALTAAGSVLTISSQAAITLAALDNMGITGVAALTAIKTAALGVLGPLLAVAGGVMLGSTIANSEGWKRITQKGEFDAVWKHLNEVNADKNASKDFKARTFAEGIDKFEAAGLQSDADEVRKQYKAVTGQDYVKSNPQTDALKAQIAQLQGGAGAGGGAAPGGASVSSAESGDDVEAIEDELHRNPNLTATQKKALHARLYDARKAQKAERAEQKEEKEQNHENDAASLAAAKLKGQEEKADTEVMIHRLHEAMRQRKREEEDSTERQIRAYEDAHKKVHDGDLNNTHTLLALLKSGFSFGQIETARKVEEAAKKEARKNGQADETEKSRHIEDLRKASRRKIEDEEVAERDAEQSLRAGSRNAAAALIAGAESNSSNPLTRIKGHIAALRDHVENVVGPIVNPYGSPALAAAGGAQPHLQVQGQRDLGNGKAVLEVIVDMTQSIANAQRQHSHNQARSLRNRPGWGG